MRPPYGCSTPAPKSSVAKQWIKEELAEKNEDQFANLLVPFEKCHDT